MRQCAGGVLPRRRRVPAVSACTDSRREAVRRAGPYVGVFAWVDPNPAWHRVDEADRLWPADG